MAGGEWQRLAQFAIRHLPLATPIKTEAPQNHAIQLEERQMKTRKLRGIEALEVRRCLTVAATLSDDGDLIVVGDADGAVEIVALDEGSYQISDNGVVIETIDGVTDDVRIEVDSDGAAADDHVTLDLAGQAVDRVMVELGDGDNTFIVQGGTVSGGLRYRGGDGNDELQIAADAVVQSSARARMGNGDNQVLVEGMVGRSLTVRAGVGEDRVEIAVGARVDGRVYASLGDGTNQVTHGGAIGRDLRVRGGVDDDTVELLAGSIVERSVSLSLSDGDNRLLAVGTIEGHLRYRGGEGNDSVQIMEEASVGRNTRARLGAGDNRLLHVGEIAGNLRATSGNAEDADRFDVEQGVVGGETELTPGEETSLSGRPARRAFGPRGFRFGRRA